MTNPPPNNQTTHGTAAEFGYERLRALMRQLDEQRPRRPYTDFVIETALVESIKRSLESSLTHPAEYIGPPYILAGLPTYVVSEPRELWDTCRRLLNEKRVPWVIVNDPRLACALELITVWVLPDMRELPAWDDMPEGWRSYVLGDKAPDTQKEVELPHDGTD